MDIICLNIEFENEELDKYGRSSACAIEQLHHAHLVIENLDSPELSLKVFFQEETGLSDKIGQWIVNNPQRNLFNLIRVNDIPTNDDSYPSASHHRWLKINLIPTFVTT